MRRRLGQAEVAVIVSLIEVWTDGEPLTWDGIIAHAAGRLGYEWTRQALERHPEIKLAYQARRDAARAGIPRRSVDPVEVMHVRAIEARDVRIRVLQERIGQLEARLALHAYNAQALGISPGVLEKPLPDVDRRADEEG